MDLWLVYDSHCSCYAFNFNNNVKDKREIMEPDIEKFQNDISIALDIPKNRLFGYFTLLLQIKQGTHSRFDNLSDSERDLILYFRRKFKSLRKLNQRRNNDTRKRGITLKVQTKFF